MFSIFFNPQQSAAFGQFLAKLGGLVVLALAVWAGLYAAAASQHERYPVVGQVQPDRRSADAPQPAP